MKKSAPRMGLETSAKVKECTGLKAPKSRFKVQEPKVSMVDPLAARRAPKCCVLFSLFMICKNFFESFIGVSMSIGPFNF